MAYGPNDWISFNLLAGKAKQSDSEQDTVNLDTLSALYHDKILNK